MESCIRTSVNASFTPEFCGVRLGVRIPPGEGYRVVPSISSDELVDTIKKRIAKLQKEDPNLEAKVTVYWGQNLSSVVPAEEPVVKLLQEAIRHVQKRAPPHWLQLYHRPTLSAQGRHLRCQLREDI